MSVQVRRRREAASFLSSFVGAQGELLVDTTNNRVQVHDGSTPGGWPAARLADLPSSASPLALSQGGTGAVSANAALIALGAIGRTSVADAVYTALPGDRTIAFASLTAARVVTLPAANTYPTGTALTVFDESGACSSVNAITITCTGSDTINGATSVAITAAYGYIALESNGTAKWTVIDSVVASSSSSGGSGTTVPAPTASTLGGTFAATASANQFQTGVSTTGAPTFAQPSFGNLNGTIATAQFPASGAAAGTYGSASQSLSATVDATGRLTSVGQQTIAVPASQVSGLGALATLSTAPIANGGTGATTASAALTSLGAVAASTLSVANGVATLDSSGKLSSGQIPASLVGAVVYQGTWNAATNTPTLTSGSGSKGAYYKVATAGTTNLNGVTQWNVGDTAIFDGSSWDKIDGIANEVITVNGYTGTVVLAASDISGVATSGANSNITSLSGLTTALSIGQGGTGATTASAALLVLGVIGRVPVADANVTATSASRTIAFTSITATRTVTLPAASTFPLGMTLTIIDESGQCSATNTIVVTAAGTDKINGGASVVASLPYAYVALESNGSNAWTILDLSTNSMAQQPSGGVAITGGTINGTVIGGTVPAAVAATSLSATGTVTLPANSLTLAMEAQAPTLTLRGNLTGATANVADSTLSAHIDAAFGSPRGSTLYRGVSGWAALAPGASGFVLTSNGSGADPSYQASTGGSGGSSSPRSSVRQTVQAGPVSAGAPSILPQGAARDVVLHVDGTNGATTTTDSGGGTNAPHTVTIGGTSSISTAQSKFGTASLFCASGSTVNTNGAAIAAAADLGMGTGDFTVECWLYLAANPTAGPGQVFGNLNGASGSDSFNLHINTNGAIATTTPSTAQYTGSAGQVSLNTWHHVAMSRQSGTMRIFLDGTQQTSYSDTNNYSASYNWGVGRNIAGGANTGYGYDLAAYIDEFATLKGTGVYTANFTPPSSPFAPASSSLSLSTQNIGSTAPFTIAAAIGFGTTGQNDLVYQYTANISWTLTASATNYLALNASTGAVFVTTLQPIDQYGGTISTVNGQFTFDRQAMIGYLGNGTAAVATPLVFVGEAVAGASTVNSTLAYTYDGFFDSGWMAGLPTVGVLYQKNSNLGGMSLAGPRLIIECTTADNGYAVGDEQVFQSSSNALSLVQGRNTAGAIVTSSGWPSLNKSTGAAVYLTAANWKSKIVHVRGWGGA